MSEPSPWIALGLAALNTFVSGFAIWKAGTNSTNSILLSRKLDRDEANRRRLDIATKHWPPTGLQLDFTYEAEFHHVGLRATVSLSWPDEATLKQLRWVSNPAPIDGQYYRQEQGSPLGSKSSVRLLCKGADQPFYGSILIIAPKDWREPLRGARIEVVIESDHGDELLHHRLTVSPIEQPDQFWNLPPQPTPVDVLAAILAERPELNQPYTALDDDANPWAQRQI